MAVTSRQDSNRMYSWLWDSRISPRNSKWLRENLSDIDSTVKQMIRIIEEDGDSFARRAEMYYKRRPELMRLVELFYRSYRGLVERYSHATGVIRQAHHTMAEAFPDQVPPLLTDESSARPVMEHCEEGLFGFCQEGLANVLNFRHELEKDEVKSVTHSSLFENLEAEKQDGIEMALKKLSALESRLIGAEEELRRLKEQASRAGAQVHLLNEALKRSEAENVAAVIQYKKCVERISILETELYHSPPGKAETQVQTLKNALAAGEAEKETILAQHSQCAVMISGLQAKLLSAEDDARRICGRARKAEDEVECLRKEIAKLDEEVQVRVRQRNELQHELKSLRHKHEPKESEALVARLQELKQKMEKESEQEGDKAFMAEIEILVLQKVMEDLEGKNRSLVDKVHELVVSTNLSENIISELEHRIQMQVRDLHGRVETLRVGMNKVSRSLMDTDADHEVDDAFLLDETHMELLLHKVEDLKHKLRQRMDSNELLVLEKSVLVMLFGQLRMEAAEAEKEREALLEKLNIESQKLIASQNEVENLLKMNDMLKQKEDERSDHEEKLKNGVEALKEKFSELQGSYQNLQTQNAKVLQEDASLRKDFLELKQKNRALEDENCTVLVEALSLSNISLLLKNFVTDMTVKVEELDGLKNELEKTVGRLESDLEMVGAENMHLSGSVQKLDEVLTRVKTANDQLTHVVVNGKDLLHKKESQLHEVEQKLIDTQKEKVLLENKFEVLKRDYNKVQESRDEQILKLSNDNSREIVNNTFLHKMANQLEAELAALREHCKETEAREKALSYETEVRKIESEASLSKLLVLSIEEAALTEFIRELADKCRSLDRQRISEQVVKERVSRLEGENVGLKAQLDTFTAAVDSVRNCFLSLESCAFLRVKLLKRAEESKDHGPGSSLQDGGGTIYQRAELVGGVAKVQDLQNRIKAVEKVMEDMERLGRPDTEIKNEVAREELPPGRDLRIKTAKVDASYVDSDTPKDITLDQACKHEHYGSSRTDDRMLELWEIGSEGQSIDLTVRSKGQNQKANRISEIISVEEEELEVVDKLEVSKRFIDSYHEENKRKMLEKLKSDGLKLTNLQITVRDLKMKVEMTERIKKKDHDFEYSTVKEQLEEAEEAIKRLWEINAGLKKAVQESDNVNSSNGKSQSEFEHGWSLRRRRILDHARRGAERLGRVQLEVQKLQFLLMKLDSEQEKKPRTRITDSGPKLLLKDYLNGRGRSVTLSSQNQSKKKMFCACIHPPTMGD